MVELNEVIQKVKALANDLGRTPLRMEIVSSGIISRHKIDKFGYDELINMANLEPLTMTQVKGKALKITDEIFHRDISRDVEEYTPREIISQPVWPKILIIGDTHFPFTSKTGLEKVYEFSRIHNPEYIIQIGDSVDFYAHSKFPRSLNVYTPEEEERLARKGLEEMWGTLKEISPDAKCYQMLGNHCMRPAKRVLESVPTVEHWIRKYMEAYFSFEGVTTIFDTREELEIAGIIFTHGFLGSEGKHRDYYLKNVVIGHLHKGWVQYRRFHGQTFWELCAGFLGEPESKPLTYNSSKLANYQLGFGWVDQFGPRFIHL